MTLKGLTAILLFLIAATIIEYIVVIYAINLGVKDETLLQGDFLFPGTDWIVTVAISPLFNLVPFAVIIVLVSSWTYLTRDVAVKPPEKWKEKVKPASKRRKERGFNKVKKLTLKMRVLFGTVKFRLLRIRGVANLWRKINFARASIRSAAIVLLVFGTLILLVSLLTYPQLIYWTVSNNYQNNPSLLSFVKSVSDSGQSVSEALAPIGWICSTINNALLSIAPGFRDSVLSLGSLIRPLVELDGAGKYLVFQNVATWVSAFTALVYGGRRRKGRRYKKGRRR